MRRLGGEVSVARTRAGGVLVCDAPKFTGNFSSVSCYVRCAMKEGSALRGTRLDIVCARFRYKLGVASLAHGANSDVRPDLQSEFRAAQVRSCGREPEGPGYVLFEGFISTVIKLLAALSRTCG